MLFEIEDNLFWSLQKRMEYIAYDQSRSWFEYRVVQKKLPIVYFVDSIDDPQICCWGMVYKIPFIGRVLKIDGESILEKIESKHYKAFYQRLTENSKGKYAFIKISSTLLYRPDLEVAIRQAGFIRPMILTSCSMSIMLDLEKENTRKRIWKRQVKSAMELGLVFQHISNPTIQHIELVCRMYDELAKTKDIKEHLDKVALCKLLSGENIHLFFVYTLEKHAIAARILYVDRLMSYDLIAANSDESRNVKGATYFLMENIFQWLKNAGVCYFDFGRIGPGIGGANSVYEFKSYSGGDVVSYLGEWIFVYNSLAEWLYSLYAKMKIHRY